MGVFPTTQCSQNPKSQDQCEKGADRTEPYSANGTEPIPREGVEQIDLHTCSEKCSVVGKCDRRS